jgi:uncharacterized protein YbjT (DUF2867 family)
MQKIKKSDGPISGDKKKSILVIGGKGKTGGRVAQKLKESGWPVRIASRSTVPAFDWHDAQGWEAALVGIDSVYITYQPDLAVPGATDAIRELSKIAVTAGVKKLVLLSGRGEEEAQECEQIIINSGLDWTIVRASWFSQNFSEGSFYEAIMGGHVALPAGDTGEPFIDVDDIADVAVVALTEDGHDSKIYEVTGPRLITFKEAVKEIAEVTGKNIQYEQLRMEDYKAQLTEYELPADIIWLISYLFTEVMDGRNEYITNGVEQALGRKPTDFSEFVRKAAAEGAWG